MEIKSTPANPLRSRKGCLVIGSHERQQGTETLSALDGAGNGELERILRRSGFRPEIGKTLHIHSSIGGASDSVLVVGCGGDGDGIGPADFRRICAAAARALKGAGVQSAAWCLSEIEVDGLDAAARTCVAIEELDIADYRYEHTLAKTRRRYSTIKRIDIHVPSGAKRGRIDEGIATGQAIAAGRTLARDLGNLPGNICTPEYLATTARDLAKRHPKVHARILDEARIERLKMNAFLAVARGSREAPRFVVLEYRGASASKAPIALIGKGITFDSGGISIKPAGAMDEMKFDMCGAASVIGTIEACARLSLPLNIVAIVPACENLPGGKAIKPGDIVTSMSGRTVEILNTDAEGRLILCDAITWAKSLEPEVIIDVATLTGACVVALGAHASGLFSNHQPLADALLRAGQDSGDRAWQMPLWPEYEKQLKSRFADVANIGGSKAGAVTAASFLSIFARQERWAHLDIAGTAWKSGKEKGATGRPVGLLCRYLIDRACQVRNQAPKARSEAAKGEKSGKRVVTTAAKRKSASSKHKAAKDA
ncbi:leucyl aminopeptidase [Thioalkalivibrio sp. HK1]|uniref:leucyl aminopeptidase n=1 Tax=Thioalkalivibrio sp. HK1 TaxID=1469245 RepID=UPI00046E75AA